MARHSKNLEFLKSLYELSGYPTEAAFARACGKQPSNMHNYLKGQPNPGKRFLKSCMERLFSWRISPTMEIGVLPEKIGSLTSSPGVYVIYDSGAQVLYIGKATNLRGEVRQTLGRKVPVAIRLGPGLKKIRPKIHDLAKYLSLYEIPSPVVRHIIEALLLRVFANQTHNSNIGRVNLHG